MLLFSGNFGGLLYIELAQFLILILALALLIRLTIIDFRVRLLPNIYVFPFGILGILFHALGEFYPYPLEELIIGALLGYGLLWSIRALGSWYYQQEALGLGDVKLMAAAGLWLGPEYLALSLVIGASLSIIHGVIYALITKKSLRRLEIPAGPGLIGGIIVMGLVMIFQQDWIIIEAAFNSR